MFGWLKEKLNSIPGTVAARLLTTVSILLFICGCEQSRSIEWLDWLPGMHRSQILQQLEAAGLHQDGQDREMLVFNYDVLPGVYAEQRAILLFTEDGELDKIYLQVLPFPNSTGNDVLRLYDEVRQQCIRLVGVPTWEIVEGNGSGPDLLRDLTWGRAVRMAQWEDRTRSMRMGIPERVDGKVLIELLVTREPLPRSDRMWGAPVF